MKVPRLWVIVVAILFAIVAWFIPAPIHFWRDNPQYIVAALAIVAAAAFVRAARGLPNFSSTDVDVASVKDIIDAAKCVFRLVRLVILFCFVNIIWLIILAVIYAPLEEGRASSFANILERAFSSISGALAGIVISLTWMTLRGDLRLLNIQCEVALRITERRDGAEAAECGRADDPQAD